MAYANVWKLGLWLGKTGFAAMFSQKKEMDLKNSKICRIDITSTSDRISVWVKGREIFFEVPSWINPSCDFAIWVALPIAMRFGGVLQVNGATSKQARENAEALSVIWSTWLPKKFRPVKVVSENFPAPTVHNSNKSLMLFSGGVDSTFALREFSVSGHDKPDLLTVHGMDYKRSDFERFEQLQTKTAKFRDAYSRENFQVRSNAASIMRRFGIDSGIGHGFQLFATLFLFDETHSNGMIAADFTRQQDYLSLPWGTNSLTNELFRGINMRIITLSDDVTRGDKLAHLVGDDLALNSLSFCKNYAVRPGNCGTCSKCVRTKAMIFASGNEIPDIFKIREFHPDDLRFLDVSKSIEVAFCLDVLRLAKFSGREECFSFLRNALLTGGRRSKTQSLIRRAEAYFLGRRAN